MRFEIVPGRMARPTLLSLLCTLSVAALPAQQGRAFQPADWYRLTTVGSPAMSPDGRLVAFTVTRVVEATNRRHAEIWVAPTAGGEPTRYSSPSFSSTNPRWSPDGSLLIFNSTRPGGQGPWAIRMDRPGGEAFAYDSLRAGSRTADGRTVVWTEPAPRPARAPADSAARGRPLSRAPFNAITAPLDPARFDGLHITHQRFKANGPGFLPGPTEAPAIRPTQLWVQTEGQEKRQLTTAPYSHRNAAVSPDGRWIAFLADARLRPDSVVQAIADSLAVLPYDATRDEAPRNDSDIFVIPAGGGAPRRVAEIMGTESGVTWSPDGRQLAFVARATRTANSRVMVVPAEGGAPVNLLGEWPYEPAGFEWLPNGLIAMNAEVGGRSGLFHVDPRTRRMTEVLGGRRRLSGFSWDRAGTRVAYVATSVTSPTELYLAGADGTGERQVTRFNEALNREVAWADAERFTYPSVDGLEIEGWLMKPHGYQADQRYPVVLYIHGGPHSAYGENWFDEFQNLAGAGMFVLYTNPRGSSGYGAEFNFSTRGRWFAEDYEDLMRAVDRVAVRSDIDSTRMGVTGGSYGGVMGAWVTVKTSRFRAAQLDRMISNWWSWYGTSDAQGLTEFEFFGRPWDNPVLYDTLSPIRYLPQVRTPTLIVQSEEDHRTPMADAEQWFLGLKKHGVPVEFVRYPRSTHDLSRTGEPWLLVDRLGRLRQWFTHWLAPVGAAAPRTTSEAGPERR